MEIERKIGEIFEVDGVKLKCVECTHDYCKDCYFRNKGMQCVRQKCVYRSRKDSKTVKFIQI